MLILLSLSSCIIGGAMKFTSPMAPWVGLCALGPSQSSIPSPPTNSPTPVPYTRSHPVPFSRSHPVPSPRSDPVPSPSSHSNLPSRLPSWSLSRLHSPPPPSVSGATSPRSSAIVKLSSPCRCLGWKFLLWSYKKDFQEIGLHQKHIVLHQSLLPQVLHNLNLYRQHLEIDYPQIGGHTLQCVVCLWIVCSHLLHKTRAEQEAVLDSLKLECKFVEVMDSYFEMVDPSKLLPTMLSIYSCDEPEVLPKQSKKMQMKYM